MPGDGAVIVSQHADKLREEIRAELPLRIPFFVFTCGVQAADRRSLDVGNRRSAITSVFARLAAFFNDCEWAAGMQQDRGHHSNVE